MFGINPGASQPQPRPLPPIGPQPPDIVDLGDVELLLDYVARTGKALDPAVLAILLPAVRKGQSAWDDPNAPALFSAVSQLAKAAWPVTADSIRASQNDAPRQITIFRWLAIVFTVVILPLSYCSFTTSQLSKSIDADLKTVSVSVVLQDGTPPTSQPSAAPTLPPTARWQDVQQFTLATHSIEEQAEKLNGFLFWGAVQPDSSKASKTPSAPLRSYYEVLMFTKQVQNDIGVYYGVLNAVILPILYALLGACAFLLRLFTTELNSQTFSSRYVIAARFVVAMIAGLIVGLFNTAALTQNTTLSPLALAFLVGYASDVFFSFLEGIIQTVKKPSPAAPA